MKKLLLPVFCFIVSIVFAQSADNPLLMIDTSKGLSLKMVLVKGGSFEMGSSTGKEDEKPIHSVSLTDYYIGATEVTVGQFRAFVKATNYQTEIEKKSTVNWRYGVDDKRQSDDNQPVIRVSYNDAIAYCEWLSKQTGKLYRLPTEAEWEYAACGGNQSKHTIYSGSDQIDLVGWYDGNAGRSTHAVAQKAPNELGIYDMTGNVWEWCADWYAHDYYADSPSSNPQGAATGTLRVVRGGSWMYFPLVCRPTRRSCAAPDAGSIHFGFRVVMNRKL